MATIPRKDEDFLAFGRNVYELTVSRAADWGYTTKELQEFSALENDAENTFEANKNPRTSNRTTSGLKKAAFAAYEKFLRVFVKKLEVNDKVTDAELFAMGLQPRVRPVPGRLPVPTGRPEIEVVAGKSQEVDVYASLPQEGHPTEYLKDHHGIGGIAVRYRVEDEEEKVVYSTSTTKRLYFSPEQVKKYVTVEAAWVNPRMEHGPFCPPVRVLIN